MATPSGVTWTLFAAPSASDASVSSPRAMKFCGQINVLIGNILGELLTLDGQIALLSSSKYIKYRVVEHHMDLDYLLRLRKVLPDGCLFL